MLGTVNGNGSPACPFATITQALGAIRAVGATGWSVYVEPAIYSAETFPLDIPATITVESDPNANLSSDKVVIDGMGLGQTGVGQATLPSTVLLEGNLQGVTVRNKVGARIGGALVRMMFGSPTITACQISGAGSPDGGTICAVVGFSADAGTLSPTITSTDFSECWDGMDVQSDPPESVLLQIGQSSFHGNGNDGLWVGPGGGALNVQLGSGLCGSASGPDNSGNMFRCNRNFGIERVSGSSNTLQINVTNNEFMYDPPSVPLGSPKGAPRSGEANNNGGIPFDLNSCAGFLTGCNAALGACAGSADPEGCGGSSTTLASNMVGSATGANTLGNLAGSGFGGSTFGASGFGGSGFGASGFGGSTFGTTGSSSSIGGLTGSTSILPTITVGTGLINGAAGGTGAGGSNVVHAFAPGRELSSSRFTPSSNSPDSVGCGAAGGGGSVWAMVVCLSAIGRRGRRRRPPSA